MKNEFLKPEFKDYMDAVSYYNEYKLDAAINVFNAYHKRNKKGKSIEIKDYKTKGKEIVIKNNSFIVGYSDTLKLPNNTELTPFQVLLILQFKGNIRAAILYLERKYMRTDMPYIRVGVDYYKLILKPDRYGIERQELKRWSKTELITDYGKEITDIIPKCDDFTIEPDNLNYQPIIKSRSNVYRNLYSKFDHDAKLGEWKWTKILLDHVFGEQYELGLKYMQCLYLIPKQILPILVLASRERTTGKTTFINWCNQIFGANATIINPTDLTSDFNGSYASCNVIAIEETMLDKNTSIEKLKSITTAKYISVNRKNVDHYKIPFFGKVIIATNNVENFARIDDEEIRFWVREIPKIKFQNPDIETDLAKEIPAFLQYLKSLPDIEIKSRMVFTPEEIANNTLDIVKKESKPTLYKELVLNIMNHFDETGLPEVEMTLKDIKDTWFINNHKVNTPYIKTILIDHFSLEQPLNRYYTPIHSHEFDKKKKGRAYLFSKDLLRDIEWTELEEHEEQSPF